MLHADLDPTERARLRGGLEQLRSVRLADYGTVPRKPHVALFSRYGGQSACLFTGARGARYASIKK
ncbi:MAG: hypothetical protein P1U75_14265 [Antarcticimicrobium sp.]|nr:hypothetical protein [Antarcticimicrobium sp.]